MLDFSKLTLGEVALIEDLSGQSISAISDETTPKGKALAALALVVKRRAGEPTFTWNQAQELTFDEVTDLLGFDSDDQEADASGEDVTTPAKPSPPRARK